MLSRGEENRGAGDRRGEERRGGVKLSGAAGRRRGEQMKQRRGDQGREEEGKCSNFSASDLE